MLPEYVAKHSQATIALALDRLFETLGETISYVNGKAAQSGAFQSGARIMQVQKVLSDGAEEMADSIWACIRDAYVAKNCAPEEAHKDDLRALFDSEYQRIESRLPELLDEQGNLGTQAFGGRVTDYGSALRPALEGVRKKAHLAIDLYVEGQLNDAGSPPVGTQSASDSRSRDPVMRLLDRASFDAAITALVAAAGPALPLALVYCDVDHFKRVNDTHGHDKGDEVLLEVARRLQSACAGKGEVFRLGGEEVGILLPNFELNEAVTLAERCRRALGEEKCAGLPITASFGVSVYPTIASTRDALVKTADAAMYDAKKRSRNLVRYYGEPEPEPETKAKKPSGPPRRKPTPDTLSDEQLAKFRDLYFDDEPIHCPKDGTQLRIDHESRPIGSHTMVVAYCPKCGLAARF